MSEWYIVRDGKITAELRFVVHGRKRNLPNGDVLYPDCEITSPPKWAGQMRDITVRADGGLRLGADKMRGAAFG